MNELVSVIVPIYKVEKYIHKCVDSILSQTYGNLEVILVDDGSPDKCGAICDEYGRMDQRVTVIHKENGGLSDARNAALDCAKGDFIFCVDSDDYLRSDAIEKLVDASCKYDADIAICSNYEVRQNRLIIADRVIDNVLELDKEAALRKLVEDQEIKNYAWGKLYRASLFKGVRYPVGRNYEDIPTTYLLFDKAVKVVRVPDYLYFYLIRQDSISFNNSGKTWHVGCHAACLGYEERAEYFKEKGYEDLYQLAMGKLLPYLYSDIKTAYETGEQQDARQAKEYLLSNKKAFESSKYADVKDKKLINIYLSNKAFYGAYDALKKPALKGKSYVRRFLRRLGLLGKPYDFSLPAGIEKRVIFFELPGFDNLGDHALSYVTGKILQNIVDLNSAHSKAKLYVVDSWDTINAARILKKHIGKNDVIVCQGGGNFGNLYEFAREFRNQIMSLFPDNRIIILPQTVYYTDDKDGRSALMQDQKIIVRCKDLTIYARDGISYDLFGKYFGEGFPLKKDYQVKIRQLHDTVFWYDGEGFSSSRREGIVCCLRSDKESRLMAKDKMAVIDACKEFSDNVHVTDTCTNYVIDPGQREAVLFDKLTLWGSSKLVITDRLHGMIFAIITGTSCIVLGNNHHKVRAAYETFSSCPYLKYAENIDDIRAFIPKLITMDNRVFHEDMRSLARKDIENLEGQLFKAFIFTSL